MILHIQYDNILLILLSINKYNLVVSMMISSSYNYCYFTPCHSLLIANKIISSELLLIILLKRFIMKQKALMHDNYKSYIQDALYNAYIYNTYH